MTRSWDRMVFQIKSIPGWTLKVMGQMVYNNSNNRTISIKEQRKLPGNASRRKPWNWSSKRLRHCQGRSHRLSDNLKYRCLKFEKCSLKMWKPWWKWRKSKSIKIVIRKNKGGLTKSVKEMTSRIHLGIRRMKLNKNGQVWLSWMVLSRNQTMSSITITILRLRCLKAQP